MKYWINAIGYGLPLAIRLTDSQEYKGHKMWRTWYGRYDLNTRNVKKVKLILSNR